jgi:hypothetical protein
MQEFILFMPLTTQNIGRVIGTVDVRADSNLYQLLGQKPPILPQGAPTSPMFINIAAMKHG